MTPWDGLLLQVMATRASAHALTCQLDVLIRTLNEARTATPDVPAVAAPASTPSVPDPSPAAEACTHPEDARYLCPRMGYPNAYLCRVCGEEVLIP